MFVIKYIGRYVSKYPEEEGLVPQSSWWWNEDIKKVHKFKSKAEIKANWEDIFGSLSKYENTKYEIVEIDDDTIRTYVPMKRAMKL